MWWIMQELMEFPSVCQKVRDCFRPSERREFAAIFVGQAFHKANAEFCGRRLDE
jgi:hypothetical protein